MVDPLREERNCETWWSRWVI